MQRHLAHFAHIPSLTPYQGLHRIAMRTRVTCKGDNEHTFARNPLRDMQRVHSLTCSKVLAQPHKFKLVFTRQGETMCEKV